jgi:tryptophanyl-tRNA synthetase
MVSGIQPTGTLHLGNYLGSILQWLKFQDDHRMIVFLADLHAITLPQDPAQLHRSIRFTVATYLAAGMDPTKSMIFAQSSVAGHAELGWIFSCLTPLGWLNRMTQFKEKAGKDREQASLGLYGYPVLMAADILLYKADFVPVGDDQKQHLELTRDIAGAFNRHVAQEFFILPQPLIVGNSKRVMSLRDGTSKMSKSDSSDQSRINLTDDSDVILKKIMKAKTDPIAEINYDMATRPETSNLINIYSTLENKTTEEVVQYFMDKGFAIFKKELAEVIISHLTPIKTKITDYMQHPEYIDQVLRSGKEQASKIAQQTLREIKQLMGFWS